MPPYPTAVKIMVIRHAEKPRDGDSGVDDLGEMSKHDLTVRGWQRAGALACLFAPTQGLLQDARLARPGFLFASAASGDASIDDASRSPRPKETIKPLAQKLQLEIDLRFSKGQEQEVARAAQACDGVVLIAWQHEAIHSIANAILGDGISPQNWPDNRFDVVYVFTLDTSTGMYGFDQVTQCLLAGDSTEKIA